MTVCLPRSYVEAAERLQAESGVSLTRVDVADNIDLLYILAVGYVSDVPVPLLQRVFCWWLRFSKIVILPQHTNCNALLLHAGIRRILRNEAR